MGSTVNQLLAEAAALALTVSCGQCWQPPGQPCGASGTHLARYMRAARKGLVTGTMLAAVVAAVDEVTPAALVPDVTP